MGGRGRVKRQQVNTEDGWTVITHGLSNLSVGHGKKKGKANRGSAQAGSMPTDLVQGLTSEKLLQDFKNRTEKWKTTVCAEHLESVLAKRKWSVNNAVCIGIGSFSRDWEHRHRAMWQLVLFISVVSQLRGSNTEVKLYAQEPAFTSMDEEFLDLLAVHVCADDIAAHITPLTFIFSPFVDWYLLIPMFLNNKDPVLYVGNEILDDYTVFAQTEDKKAKLEQCNDMGRNWIEKREMVKLRDFEMHPHALNGMVVYWLPEVDADDNTPKDEKKVAENGEVRRAGTESATIEAKV